MTSPENKFNLAFQNGDLVLKDKWDRVWFHHKVAGTKYPPYRLVMQADNNLVLYDARDAALWASGTGNQGTSEAARADVHSI